MSIALKKFTDIELSHVQTRPEHHGEALVTAIDLSFVWNTNNRSLDMIHPDLREAFFTLLAQPEPEPGQQKMDLPVDELPNLRFAKLKYPLKFDYEQVGMHTEIDYGLGGKSNIHLSLCKVKNIQVTPVEGGTVELKFTVSSNADLDEKTIGVLAMQAQRTVTLKLLPPKPGSAGDKLQQQLLEEEEGGPVQGELCDGDGDGAPAEGGDATAAFIATEPTAAKKAAKKPAAKKAAKKTPAKKGGKRA